MDRKKSFLSLEQSIAQGSDRRQDLTAQQEMLSSGRKLLSRTDRILSKLISHGDFTHADVAALLGISKSSLSYHIARLKKLLRHDFLVAGCPLHRRSTKEWKIIRLACFSNRTIKAISHETGLSPYRVRKYLTHFKQKPKHKTVVDNNSF